jgi:hypothetical protein
MIFPLQDLVYCTARTLHNAVSWLCLRQYICSWVVCMLTLTATFTATRALTLQRQQQGLLERLW